MTMETYKDLMKYRNNLRDPKGIKEWRAYKNKQPKVKRKIHKDCCIILQKGITKEQLEDLLLNNQHNVYNVWFDYAIYLLENEGDVIIPCSWCDGYHLPRLLIGYKQLLLEHYTIVNKTLKELGKPVITVEDLEQ